MIEVMQCYLGIAVFTSVVLTLFAVNGQILFWDIKVNAKPRTGRALSEETQQKANAINNFLSSLAFQVIFLSILWPLA